ncbi:MAG: glycine betaine ABC transporter substrate-binding protein, partial [Actinomycetota bacterium]
MKRTNHSARHTTRAVGAAGLAVLALTTLACTKKTVDTTPIPQVMPRVAITSVKGDVTSELLAAIYARALENAGVRITRKDPVAMDRPAYYKALQDGQFQMIPEFSDELLKYVLDSVDTGTTPSTTEAIAPATTRAPITIPTTTTVPTTTTTGATTTTAAGATTTAGSTTTSAATTTTGTGSTT